jgi:outer membrane protein assembly factor BamB
MQRPEIAWTNTLAGPIVFPITTDGQVTYAVAAGSVYAMDTEGLKRWVVHVQAAGPAVVSSIGLLVPRADGRIAVLDPSTGSVLRETKPAGPTSAAPVLVEGVIAWTTEDGVFATSDGVRKNVSGGALTDLAADGTLVYVGSRDGHLLALDRSGVIWDAQLPGPAVAHPVVGDGSVFVAYAGTQEGPGGVAAVSRTDGKVRWSSSIRGGPGAGPALGALLIVPGRSGELVGLDPHHGGVRWKSPGTAAFSVQPVIAGGMAYVGNADGRVHRIDLHDGGEAWSVDLGGPITGDPVLIDGRLLVGLADGRLVCLK